MISMEAKGDLSKTYRLLDRILKRDFYSKLERYGKLGVELLSSATPIDTGKTANSWDYEIVRGLNSVSIRWLNTNIVDGRYNVAILLQYGHGTNNGGYVQGIDYINPTLKPVFEEMINDIWGEVTK